MVKRWIIILCISVILVVGGIVETKYTQDSLYWLIESVEELELDLKANKDEIDADAYVKKANAIDDKWDKKLNVLKCLVWHSCVKDIEIGLARIVVYIEENDFTEAYAECESLIDYANHYLDDFKITLENIL